MTAPIATITPAELADVLKRDPAAKLLDVRTPAEFREVHATAAKNVPLDQLCRQHAAGCDTIYVICRSGGRGAKGCEKLLAEGCAKVVNVEGGTLAWEAAGLPVVRGKKCISLERQVRIAAGSLVLAGALLAWFVHPAFVGLCGFIGAGLLFAGVTDTCGMGMLLAKMPWNQVGEGSGCATKTSCSA